MAKKNSLISEASAKVKKVKKVTPKDVTKAVKKGVTKTAEKVVASVQVASKKLSKASPKAKAAVIYKVAVGSKVDTRSLLSLRDLPGQLAVLYFYPKDNTPGCTLEGHDFKRLHKEFKKAGCEVFGVSRDSEKSHESFKSKCGFPFDLIADVDGQLCSEFDVIQMKSLYGRKFEGIERSTFIIDKKGFIKAEWRKIKVNGHAEEVLQTVRDIQSDIAD